MHYSDENIKLVSNCHIVVLWCLINTHIECSKLGIYFKQSICQVSFMKPFKIYENFRKMTRKNASNIYEVNISKYSTPCWLRDTLVYCVRVDYRAARGKI